MLLLMTMMMMQVHIVYMGSLPEGEYSPLSHHYRILQEAVENSFVENSFIRSYNRSFNGFVADLTNHEKEKLANMEEVVSVFPSTNSSTSHNKIMGFYRFTRKDPVKSRSRK
ncbi:subtilisin-like protease sbt4.2 [Quercus suber]|uniref:Subtilisin-like protease sbt4.2 n=1 Tax=Quercus suber TaxID=58331 RepID=A0AAW0MBD0_QUESU